MEECGGTNRSNAALLAALGKPRRKHKTKKAITCDLTNGVGQGPPDWTIGAIQEPVTPSMMRNGTVSAWTSRANVSAGQQCGTMPVGPCRVPFGGPSAYSPVLLGTALGNSLFSDGPSSGLLQSLGLRPPPGLSL